MASDIRPLIGVTACYVEIDERAQNRCAIKYYAPIPEVIGGVPVLIPTHLGEDGGATGESTALIDALLSRLDGVLLTGSPSNVEPGRYDGTPSVDGTHHDPARDATTLPLIRRCIALGVPMLGICRGIQEMNVALGGTLHQRIFDMPDKIDHRMRRDDGAARWMAYRLAHTVETTDGGLLHAITGARSFLVNSLHAQGIDRPGDGVVVEAVAPDGIVEAISVPSAPGFALGVQWHPEMPQPVTGENRKIFEAFGQAARRFAAARFTAAALAVEAPQVAAE